VAHFTEEAKTETISPNAATKLQPDDHYQRTTFCTELQALMEEDGFFERLIFTDECTFHFVWGF